MRFKIQTSGCRYDKETVDKYSQIGFKFKEDPQWGFILENDGICIEIDTIEQLMDIANKVKENLIIGQDTEGSNFIEIYDDYRE